MEVQYKVRAGQLYGPNGAPVCAVEVDPKNKKLTAWQKWLQGPKNGSFGFEGDGGAYFTAVREEKRLRSGNRGLYWVGHVRREGRLYRVALGSINYTHKLSLPHLQAAAARLASMYLAEEAQDKEAAQQWRQAGQRRRRIRRDPPPGRLHLPEPAITGGQYTFFGDEKPDDDPGKGAAYSEL
jgi:hypothetical protein